MPFGLCPACSAPVGNDLNFLCACGAKGFQLPETIKEHNQTFSCNSPYYKPSTKIHQPVNSGLSSFESYITNAGSAASYYAALASGPVPFHSFHDRQQYFDKRKKSLADDSWSDKISDRLPAQRLGFKTRRYSSGETTGACFFSGAKSASFLPPVRSGVLESTELTQRARTKIRRASECSPVNLRYFQTLTFAPRSVNPETGLPCVPAWCFNDDGTIRHDWAKYKVKKYLNTCSASAYRRDLKRREALYSAGPLNYSPVMPLRMQYLWVAELQDNGNIHFHILTDNYFPIKKLSQWWGQANNSVDVKTLQDSAHAVNYMRKYMTKDETSKIQGNRYFITRGLHKAMKPDEEIVSSSRPSEESAFCSWGEGASIRSLLHDMRSEIESRGGHVLDFGFSCPAPRRSREYYKKKKLLDGTEQKEKRRSKGIPKSLSSYVLSVVSMAVVHNLPF